MTTAALPLAHGIGGIKDLPVPAWLFLFGGAVVLVVSFSALGILWTSPRLEAPRGRPLPGWAQRILLSPLLRVVAGATSVGLLVLVWVSAAFGSEQPNENLAPTFVYVVFWLGVVPLVVVLGNVWSVLDPWRAAADAVAWVARRAGKEEAAFPYPAWLGRWPAALLLFAFVTMELVYVEPANPRALAVAIVLYSAVTWAGTSMFGRRDWRENGDAFAVYFGLLSRLSAFAVRERDGRTEIVVRPPLSGLTTTERRPGTVAFVAVMLGSVAFDGYSRTGTWQDLIARAEGPYIVDRPGTAELVGVGLSLWGLLSAVVLVALAYGAACAAAGMLVNAPRPLQPEFLLSLVPIAFVYELAHYFSLFLTQGQFAIPLLSDPFGRGWDLLGTADVVPDLTIVSPNTVWYVQAGALVVGHVAGLAVAHDRAVDLFTDRRDGLRSQYAMLALMVVYTVGGLWILSRG